jgi:hypothetical protein
MVRRRSPVQFRKGAQTGWPSQPGTEYLVPSTPTERRYAGTKYEVQDTKYCGAKLRLGGGVAQLVRALDS